MYPLAVAIAGLQVAEPGFEATEKDPVADPRVVKKLSRAIALRLLNEKSEIKLNVKAVQSRVTNWLLLRARDTSDDSPVPENVVNWLLLRLRFVSDDNPVPENVVSWL